MFSPKKLILESLFPYQFKYLVSSFGGCCTSMLIKFLNPWYLTKTNHMWYHLELKHSPSPPIHLMHDFKAVYLFGDPRNALISIYRRNLQNIHYYNIFQKQGAGLPQTLDHFLERGEDIFEFESHFLSWTSSSATQRTFPILFVNADFLWDHLDHLFDYLEVSRKSRKEFPCRRSRESSWEDLPAKQKEQINLIFGNVMKKIESIGHIYRI